MTFYIVLYCIPLLCNIFLVRNWFGTMICCLCMCLVLVRPLTMPGRTNFSQSLDSAVAAREIKDVSIKTITVSICLSSKIVRIKKIKTVRKMID